jgi:hypothetical protein
MDIVGAVAGMTAAIDGLHFRQRASMAVITGDVDVSALQWKVGLNVVIKCPDVPCNRVVACAAAIIEMPVMRIVFLVTGNTVRFYVSENLGGMTLFAFGLLMRTKSWELRQIVIEEHGILPIHFCMTIFTLRAKSSLVHLIVEMTRFATCR